MENLKECFFLVIGQILQSAFWHPSLDHCSAGLLDTYLNIKILGFLCLTKTCRFSTNLDHRKDECYGTFFFWVFVLAFVPLLKGQSSKWKFVWICDQQLLHCFFQDSAEFDLLFENAFDQWVASTASEKCTFFQILHHTCQRYLTDRKPEFINCQSKIMGGKWALALLQPSYFPTLIFI